MTSNRNPLLQLRSLWLPSSSSNLVLYLEDIWHQPTDALWLSLIKSRLVNYPSSSCHVFSFDPRTKYSLLKESNLHHHVLDLSNFATPVQLADEFLTLIQSSQQPIPIHVSVFVDDLHLAIWKFSEHGLLHILQRFRQSSMRVAPVSLYMRINSEALQPHEAALVKAKASHWLKPLSHVEQTNSHFSQLVQFTEQPDTFSDQFEPVKCCANLTFSALCDLLQASEVLPSTNAIGDPQIPTEGHVADKAINLLSSSATFSLTLSDKEKVERAQLKELPYLKAAAHGEGAIHYMGDEDDDFDDEDPDDDLDI